jgi:hypothetical protein
MVDAFINRENAYHFVTQLLIKKKRKKKKKRCILFFKLTMDNIFNEILKTIFSKISFSVWLVQKINDSKKRSSASGKRCSRFQWLCLVFVSGCRQTSMVGSGLWQLVTNFSKLN